MNGAPSADRHQAFSLLAGGPFFWLMRRARLASVELEWVRRRVICITLFAWLPLLALSAFQGQALGGGLEVPFLLDMDAQVRLLVVLPLLIAGEYEVHRRLGPVVQQFNERRLIAEQAAEPFRRAMASALKLRDSMLAEALLVVLVFAINGPLASRQAAGSDLSSWLSASSSGGQGFSLAGLWALYVSLPLFQFLLLRWYYRLFIWAHFLWQMSRVELRLLPTHPDRRGGLGLLDDAVDIFMPVAVAHGPLLFGVLAHRIFHAGATLPEFLTQVAVVAALMLFMLLGPLIVFVPQLARAQRMGRHEYGALAARHAEEFDQKWLRSTKPLSEPLIGSPDISSLADMGGSFDVVQRMNIVLVSVRSVVWLLIYILGPVLPLVLTMMPLSELLLKIAGVLF